MAKTVVGLIENKAEAVKTVDELLAAGFDKKDVGVISPEELAREATAAVTGASTGMLVGGLAGMLLAAVAVALPGIGTALVAGPALALVGGTALGAVAGGLIGGLTKRGVPEDDAHLLAEGVKRGATLLVVTARNDEMATKAVEILKRHGAVDLEQRAAQWRKLGWTGRMTDAAASPAASTGAPATASAAGGSGTPAPQAASSVSVAPGEPAASPASASPAQEAASDVSPGIASVTIYEFEIIEPPVRAVYTGPERRMRSIPHEPDRRLAA